MAYGIYHYYSPDIDMFLSKLAKLTTSNFEATLLDVDVNIVYENKLFDFGYNETLHIAILQSEYNIQNTKQLLPSYTLKYPINYDYENELEIDFYPNQVCLICFLTFEHLWKTFIEVLRFGNNGQSTSRPEIIKRYKKLRNEYSRVLKCLDIKSILILTHAYYNIINIAEAEIYYTMEFQNVLDEATRLDDFSIFDFEKILLAEKREQLPANFLISDELKIAFIDNISNF